MNSPFASPGLAALVLGLHLGLASAFAHSAIEPAPRTDKGWVDR
jgi:hypothetical protein